MELIWVADVRIFNMDIPKINPIYLDMFKECNEENQGHKMTLKEARKALNLSRKELAEKLEVSPRTIEAWEQGLRVPNKWIAPKVSKFIREAINEKIKRGRG